MMRRSYIHAFIAMVMGVMAPVASNAQTSEAEADGIHAYFGMVPAQIAKDWIDKHEGGRADIRNLPSEPHHLLVALYDDPTQKRISQARVNAVHRAPDGRETSKALEPMTINNTVTYGNFFALNVPGLHEFSIRVLLPGRNRSTELRYVYDNRH